MHKRVTQIWIFLILATAVTWLIGVRSEIAAASSEVSANVWILLIAGIKIWLVMDWFMELREAAARVRWSARIWLLVLLLVLSILTSS